MKKSYVTPEMLVIEELMLQTMIAESEELNDQVPEDDDDDNQFAREEKFKVEYSVWKAEW